MCEELNKGNLGKNHIIGYFPSSKIVANVFNFDSWLKKAHKRRVSHTKRVGGMPSKIGMTMNIDFFYFHYCPICGCEIDKGKYMDLIYSKGRLY